MKFNITSVILFAVLACLSIWTLILYSNNERLTQVVATMAKVSESQALRFNEALGRAEVKIDETGALIKALEKNLPDEIRNDIRERDADIIAIASARFAMTSTGGGRVLSAPLPQRIAMQDPVLKDMLPPPKTEICDVGPYQWSFQDWRFNGSLIAYCGGEGKFKYELNQKFELSQVQTDDNGHYLNLYELDGNGKRMPRARLEYYNVFKKPDETESFYFWAPHLDIAGSINQKGDLGGEATISLMGYGKTANDLSWRFVRGGLVYSSDIGAVLCPVSYNIGDPLPLLSNVWLSPCAQYIGTWGGSLSVGAAL